MNTYTKTLVVDVFNKILLALSIFISISLIGVLLILMPGFSTFVFDFEFFLYVFLVLVPLVLIGTFGTKKIIKSEKYKKLKLFAFWTIISFIFVCTVVLAFYESGDYVAFLNVWGTEYSQLSLKDAFYKIVDISNYTPVYNYFLIFIYKIGAKGVLWIKYLTFIFSIGLGFVVEKIITYIRKDEFNFLRFIFFMIVPPVLIEYAAWGQCDAIYVLFSLLALYFALKKKSKLSFMNIGLAFAFKLQFLFIVPILFILLIIKDENGEHYLKWKDIWIAPLMYAINLIPIFTGRNVLDLLLVYVNQVGFDNRISGDCANICFIYFNAGVLYGSNIYSILSYFHIFITFVVMAILLFIVLKYNKQKNLSFDELIFFGMVFSFIMVFFMPKMIDRFYFISMCLALIYYFVKIDKYSRNIALGLVFSQFLAMYPSISYGVGRIIFIYIALIINFILFVVMFVKVFNLRKNSDQIKAEG